MSKYVGGELLGIWSMNVHIACTCKRNDLFTLGEAIMHTCKQLRNPYRREMVNLSPLS